MAHINEKIDYCAEAYIIHNGKVLLRMHDKYKLWFPPGGHVELDEDPTQAAIREAKEEVGLDVTLFHPDALGPAAPGKDDLVLPFAMNRHRINEKHEHVSLSYLATTDSAEVIPSGHDRSDEWKWFSEKELDEEDAQLQPMIRFYAKKALRMMRSIS